MKGTLAFAVCVWVAMACMAITATIGFVACVATAPVGLIGLPLPGFLFYMVAAYYRERLWRL